MIPRDYITAWRQHAPWPEDAQVEQDLIICRALVDIFNHLKVRDSLAFRGGTALFKLHMDGARYSEDIDLVQVRSGPIGEQMDAIREVLNPWLGKPSWKQTEGRVTLQYRFESEDSLPLRLKIEINTREHFSIYGLIKVPYEVESEWFSGSTEILTYNIDELLSTKMRALFQRKKGRDLFDLWHAFNGTGDGPDHARVVSSFLQYMEKEGHNITRANFEENLLGKRNDPIFSEDIGPLLTAGSKWEFDKAFDFVMTTLIAQLPGVPWKGKSN